MSPTQRSPRHARRSLALLAGAALALLLAACAPTPSGPPASTTSTTTTVPSGPTITGTACPTSSGVTVVVDFTTLDDTIRLGCAPGSPANGFAALAAVGVSVTAATGPGTVCKLAGLPTQGYPYCWTTGGYWSYWKSPNRSTAWAFSAVGAGSGPLAQGSVEGWSWAAGFNSAAPRLSVAGLAAHTG